MIVSTAEKWVTVVRNVEERVVVVAKDCLLGRAIPVMELVGRLEAGAIDVDKYSDSTYPVTTLLG